MHASTLETASRLLNRDGFEQCAQTELARIQRHGGTLGVIHFALDDLPRVYGVFGRRDTDLLLDRLTAYLARHVRGYDRVTRVGTHEFAVLAPGLGLIQVTGFAVKLRRLIAEYAFDGSGLLSASFGVATLRPGEPLEQLTRRAREGVERSRRAGGNRVSASPAD